MDQVSKPGFGQALVNALRGAVGLGAQQTPGPATDVAGNYRRYLLETVERGEQPQSLQEWQNSQALQPVSTPR